MKFIEKPLPHNYSKSLYSCTNPVAQDILQRKLVLIGRILLQYLGFYTRLNPLKLVLYYSQKAKGQEST